MKRLALLIAALAVPLTAASATVYPSTRAPITAIIGGTVATGLADPVTATVLIQGGGIIAVGNVAVPPGATVIDATGKWVTPGIIAAMSQVGLYEVEEGTPSNDTAARRAPFSAGLDAATALNPASSPVAVTRQAGVTRAAVALSATHAVFGGQGALITLAAGPNLLMRGRAFQFVELGEQGARIAGGSRPAAFAAFEEGLSEARDLAANRGRYRALEPREALLTRFDAEALIPVVEGRMPLVVHVERASDIMNVLRLRARFPALKLILIGANEGWLVASEIAAAKVPVITGTLDDRPEQFESLAATKSNIGRMVAAGVTVAIGSFGDGTGNQTRNLPQFAGNTVAQGRVPGGVGLSWTQALASITVVPARIWGFTDTGSLTAGKRADVVVWDGDPLELASAPTMVLIDGVQQPLTTRQTELRDRYLRLPHDALPLQYPK